MSELKEGDKIHCPQCHKNIEIIMWACGCLRCPECAYTFRPCLPPIELIPKSKGICPECGEEIIEYIRKVEVT